MYISCKNDTWKPQWDPGVAQEPHCSLDNAKAHCELVLLFIFMSHSWRASRWAWLQRSCLGCPSPYFTTLWFSRAHFPLSAWSPCPSPVGWQGFEMQHKSTEGQAEWRAPSAGTEPAEGSCWEVVVQGAFRNIFKMCLLPLANVQTSLKCLWCQAASRPLLREISFL